MSQNTSTKKAMPHSSPLFHTLKRVAKAVNEHLSEQNKRERRLQGSVFGDAFGAPPTKEYHWRSSLVKRRGRNDAGHVF